MNYFIVGGDLQSVLSSNVVVNFNIRSIPNVVPSAETFAEFFYQIPVVVIVKFVAVAPDVKQGNAERGIEIFNELIGKRQRVSIVPSYISSRRFRHWSVQPSSSVSGIYLHSLRKPILAALFWFAALDGAEFLRCS